MANQIVVGSIKGKDGMIYHVFNGTHIECNGGSCIFCQGDVEAQFKIWEESIPFKMPPKGKRYKNKLKQKNRGKTIAEICYTCKEIPCYVCRRTKCKQWQKEKSREGQEKGCSSWENNRCTEFYCDKGLIVKKWRTDI